MKLIEISTKARDLVLDEHNPRRISPDSEAMKKLVAGVRVVGILQPIIVRDVTPKGAPHKRYAVTAGARRAVAARLAGLATIPAIERPNGADPALVGVVENLHREAMHPVDLWRAIARMVDAKMTMQAAADSLGITLAFARRLDRLGRLAPELLAAMARDDELPRDSILRTIAIADARAQVTALKAAQKAAGSGGRVDWFSLARALQVERLARGSAIFDVDAYPGIAWTEDLFAEPGAEDAFTTSDAAAFLAAQQAALERRCMDSKGREVATAWSSSAVGPGLPAGVTRDWSEIPKRFKRDDPRTVYSAIAPSGRIVSVLGIAARARERGRAAGRAQASAQGEGAVAGQEAAPARGPLTHKALAAVAGIKGEALRARLDQGFEDVSQALAAVLLALAANNVRLPTVSIYRPEPYRDLAWRLVAADGSALAVSDADLMQLAASVVGRIIEFPHPNTFVSSGDVADWLAERLATPVPRMDTETVIDGATASVLIAAAAAEDAGIDTGGTVAALRRRLLGRLPHWRPVSFLRRGPETPAPVIGDDAEGDAP